jgi:UDP-galactopyranose mutase
MKCDVKIVGCGLSGITAAVLLKEKGYNVEVFETRPHIGGNCADGLICNTLVHQYGPHIFHTDDEEVYSFLSRYTEWTPFELRPQGNTRLGCISLPYSQKTIKQLRRELTQEEIVEYIFKDYSEKQWGVPFEEIPKTITNRIPKTADCEDPTWFEGQKYQCVPKDGYSAMFARMLDGVNVHLNSPENAWRQSRADGDLIIYTGKVDSYYDNMYGELPYRSLEFRHRVLCERQDTFIVNQNNNEVEYTRVYDHSYFNPAHAGPTVITEEYPKECGTGDVPFYPIPWGDGQEKYRSYETLAKAEKDVIFLGRLATYKYLDMWMAVKHVMNKLRDL